MVKLTGLILPLLIIVYSPATAQYYFTGEVKDPHGDKLQRVAIIVQSTGQVYQTGPKGDFEITSRKADDSLTFAYNGYEQYTTAVKSTDFLQVILKMLTPPSVPRRNRLISLISRGGYDPHPVPAGNDDFSVMENPFLEGRAAMSFTGNPNGISYNNIRRFLDMGTPVPHEAVKIEEMLGYFNFTYEEPDPGELFHCHSDLVSCPWNKTHQLLYLNICARKAEMEQMPPCHLVFAIDASGSMDMPNKMPLIKAGLRLLVRNLRDIDTVSIVQYSSNLGVFPGIPGSHKEDIIRAIEQLHAEGSSSGDAGLRLAYRVAQGRFIRNGINRILLITDGDVCDNKTADSDLEELVAQESEAGITLSCIGVGMPEGENVELPALAAKGNGSFACMADEQEGERQLLKLLDESLLTVADSVTVTTRFDTTLVGAYRLIGYDNKRNLLADTALRLEGTSVSSGHSVIALFELVPRKDSMAIENIASVQIGYHLPGKNAARTMSYDCPNSRLQPFDRAGIPLKKAACIALFGMKLKGSEYAGDASWMDLERMARKVFAGNDFIDKEYIRSVVRARSIYEHKHER